MRLALADIVRAIHGAILLFVLLAPLMAQSVTVLILHVGLLLALLMHWMTSQHYCILSLVESKLRGIEYEDGFLNAVLKPLFGFGVSNSLAYAVTLALLVISITRIHSALTAPPPEQCDPLPAPPSALPAAAVPHGH